MKECLLCEGVLSNKPSWQGFIDFEKQQVICEKCSNSFERADIESKTAIIVSTTSLYAYNDAMKNYLHQFKFLQDIALAAVFQQELYDVLKGKSNIVPIPVHPNRRVTRTFSQVEALLDYAKIPYKDLLEKRDEVSMGEKTRQERLAMKPLFELKSSVQIQPESYLLVDDIYTTGTTLHSAAKVLLAAGAKRVEAVTLIRA